MKNGKMVNTTSLIFEDINTEEFREYNFPNGLKLRIEHPMALNVNNGAHRVITITGVCYYINIRDSWWITWQAYNDNPDFVK